MSTPRDFKKTYKFALQLGAFTAIMLASAGLYFSAAAARDAVSWVLLGLTALAMLVALWAS